MTPPFAHTLDDGQPEYEDSMHRSLRAAMERAEHSAAAWADDAEALARVMCEDDHRNCGYAAWDAAPEGIRRYHRDHAETILASDWLAARDADLTARAEARGAAAVLAAVEAVGNGSVDRHVHAARAAAASYTRDGAK